MIVASYEVQRHLAAKGLKIATGTIVELALGVSSGFTGVKLLTSRI